MIRNDGKRRNSHNGDGVIVEDCWDIFGGEFIGRVADEETGLAHGTVTNNHAPTRN
jgi:hypothetical protein